MFPLRRIWKRHAVLLLLVRFSREIKSECYLKVWEYSKNMLRFNFLYLTKFSYLASLLYFPCILSVSFPYFLMHIRPFEVISSCNLTNLCGIYLFKVDSKNTGTKCEVCLNLKLKNEYASNLTSERFISCNLFFPSFRF